MSVVDEVREQARWLDQVGDGLWLKSERLLERATAVKALARRLRAWADEQDDLEATRAVGGESVRRIRRVA